MLAVDTDELRGHAHAAAGLITDLDALRTRTLGAGPAPSFTTVSGLAEVGAYHAACLNGPGVEGSALAAVDYLSRHVRFVVDGLTTDADAIDGGDADTAAALRGIVPEDAPPTFPRRPAAGFPPLPRADHLAHDPDTPASVPDLAGALAATDLSGVHSGADVWGELAGIAGAVAARLTTIASSIAADSEGEVIDESAAALIDIASKASAMELNALIMAACLRFLARIVEVLLGVLDTLVPGLGLLDPSARPGVERSFLDALPGQLGVLLSWALPPMLSLLSGGLIDGGDPLAWLLRMAAGALPELFWPDDVAAAMCGCDGCTCGNSAAVEEVGADETDTGAASVGGAAGGVAGIGVGGLTGAAASLGHLGALGQGVTMAQGGGAGGAPAGISVGSGAGTATAYGPMMGAAGAGRGGTTSAPQRRGNGPSSSAAPR